MPRILGTLTYRARRLRREATPAERALWKLLRHRQVGSAKFRRQHPLGPFIVDFFCDQARLVVEADGAQHRPPPAQDINRDAFLEAAGLRVLRFANGEILERPDSVVTRIRSALLPSPLGRGVGGEGTS